jgi:16S rRNA (uracil1498-N3)-methyltransferase
VGAAVPPRAAAQVFVADPAAPELTPEDHHHLARVLRLTPGEVVIAADGHGGSAICRFTGDGPLLEPTAAVTRHPRPVPALTIGFAPAKGDRPEWVVQKLTELGVDRIVPLVTERGVVRWDRARAAKAVERFGRIAREAAAQSRRPWLPVLDEPVALGDLVERDRAVLAVADLGGGPPSLEQPVLAIGPEGGWSDAERALGLPSVRLGDGVLRAETAAVAAATLLGALRAGLVSTPGAQ